MTVQSPARRPLAVKPWTIPTAVTAVLVVAVLVLQPDPGVLAELSPVIKIHLGAAVAAFILGVVMLNSTKGAKFHRRAGWVWATLMLVVAVSSLFITELFKDHWSPIHILSGLTLFGLPVAVAAAKRHNVRLHQRMMKGMFWGGMVVAGGFAFVPGRVMFRLFFG